MNRPIEAKVVSELLDEDKLLPAYATPGAAALDLRACITTEVSILPGERKLFPSGIALNMKDPSLVAVIAPRSGLALKHGLRAHFGVIDSDYNGEIGVLMHNDSSEEYKVQPLERIAQLMFQPIVKVDLEYVSEFAKESERGKGGFGSTGKE